MQSITFSLPLRGSKRERKGPSRGNSPRFGPIPKLLAPQWMLNELKAAFCVHDDESQENCWSCLENQWMVKTSEASVCAFTRQNHDDAWHQDTMKADELHRKIKLWHCDLLAGSNVTRSTILSYITVETMSLWPALRIERMITAQGMQCIRAVKAMIQTPVRQWLALRRVYLLGHFPKEWPVKDRLTVFYAV